MLAMNNHTEEEVKRTKMPTQLIKFVFQVGPISVVVCRNLTRANENFGCIIQGSLYKGNDFFYISHLRCLLLVYTGDDHELLHIWRVQDLWPVGPGRRFRVQVARRRRSCPRYPRLGEVVPKESTSQAHPKPEDTTLRQHFGQRS